MTQESTAKESASTHQVFIITQGGAYSVVPKALGLTRGDRVIFRAVGVKDGLTLFFPDAELFGEQKLKLDPDEPKTLTVEGRGLKPNVYPFAVYSREIRQFVRASPSPKLVFYD